MVAPIALITSADEAVSDGFITDILEVKCLPEGCKLTDDIVAYDWHIDTKYYTADVKLCVNNNKSLPDKEIASAVEAFIICFDTSKENSFENVTAWLPFLNEVEPAIQLLVCDRCSDTDVNNSKTVQKWCLDNGFELVEQHPEEDSDEEDDFADTVGTKRIIEALQSHNWSNAVIKDNPNTFSPYCLKLLQEAACLSEDSQTEPKLPTISPSVAHQDKSGKSQNSNDCNSAASEDVCKVKNCDIKSSGEDADKGNQQKPTDPVDCLLDAAFPGVEDLELLDNQENEESFEKLFEKLSLMKQKSSELLPDERKQYAEKMAVLFWKAIGGEDDEIEGLDIDL